MSKEEDNKAVVGRWFTEFWGKRLNLGIVDEIAAPDMLLKYSLHEPRCGRDDIKAFMTDFRAAFPDLNFWGTADLIAEGDYVVGQWEGGGTHTGDVVFDDLPIGSIPAASGKMPGSLLPIGSPLARRTTNLARRGSLCVVARQSGHLRASFVD